VQRGFFKGSARWNKDKVCNMDLNNLPFESFIVGKTYEFHEKQRKEKRIPNFSARLKFPRTHNMSVFSYYKKSKVSLYKMLP
jgi:hypothetical protein